MNEQSWYSLAKTRVNESPELEMYEVILFYDWLEEDHYEWVATAPLAELLAWVDVVEMYL